MPRLALARTKVSGSITLQGNTFTFTASASGTGWDDNIPEAKRVAVAASNTAATVAARASIDKILTDNSAILTDLEITSLISTNLNTTVVVFRPIAIEKIATTTNGVDYKLKPNATIWEDEMLTVPSGIKLQGEPDKVLTNYGYLLFGDEDTNGSGLKETNSSKTICYTLISLYNSPGATVTQKSGTCLNISDGCSFVNDGTYILYGKLHTYDELINNNIVEIYGGLYTEDGGVVTNNYSLEIYDKGFYEVYEGGTTNNWGQSHLTIYSGSFNNGGVFNNWNTQSGINNKSTNGTGTIYNLKTGVINNGGTCAFINDSTETFTNDGQIYNTGDYSTSSPYIGDGGCTASGYQTRCNTNTPRGSCHY